jgi:hypothetical protein
LDDTAKKWVGISAGPAVQEPLKTNHRMFLASPQGPGRGTMSQVRNAGIRVGFRVFITVMHACTHTCTHPVSSLT